ncbi:MULTISPECIES: hypothetical protein [Cyanophyceae]|uniref:hypothetical protein n=1 Tax=Cyanophyceae TaxID=3028117 RepID=UPI0016883274|nr:MULTISPECIES: hypothetical protein [Cyanophyceae]MBD1918862.1 hypothetical protein [Phormidium sp. FACHB-77]MBD2033295.1 hypothetical protein [Phormidium sp. FACHB-322]MBD2053772.1 hypothetical protein [Leptolyngbya sp. FACHB-60]
MGITGFQRQRRLLAAQAIATTPATPLPPGNTPQPPTGTPVNAIAPTPAVPKALVVFNSLGTVREVEIVPTIGKGAAKAILENRPDGGYESLQQVWDLNPKILKPPYTTDPAAIAAWGND